MYERDQTVTSARERSMTARERTPVRRRSLASAMAALALVAPLAGCTEKDDRRIDSLPQRNAPASAPYSRDANPVFYADIRRAEGYIPADKRPALEVLSKQAVAEWLPTDPDEAVSTIQKALTKSDSDGTVPVFVSYAIPNRDLGGHSAGGLADETYEKYAATVSRAIGVRDAIVVVEPDALAQIPEMNGEEQDERINLLARAMDAYAANKNTAVYLDAGNSRWRTPGHTAGLLKDVSSRMTGPIPGISLNVSNYQSDDDTRRYADEVTAAYGQDLYILIDSSRNGDTMAAASGEWCNPADQTLGTADPDFDANARVETVYVKTPGESDGNCGVSERPAGEFDGDLLLRQLG